MLSVLVVFVLSVVAAGAVGLPVDYVWRRFPRPVGVVAGAANAFALVAVVVAAAALGLATGAGLVVGLVLGLVAGSAAANGLAERWWGPRTASGAGS